MADPVFAPGDRVATNELFKKTFPKMKVQTGGVILPMSSKGKRTSSKQHKVLWDGQKVPRPFHATFLKREGTDG
jgi:hypothetical protein